MPALMNERSMVQIPCEAIFKLLTNFHKIDFKNFISRLQFFCLKFFFLYHLIFYSAFSQWIYMSITQISVNIEEFAWNAISLYFRCSCFNHYSSHAYSPHATSYSLMVWLDPNPDSYSLILINNKPNFISQLKSMVVQWIEVWDSVHRVRSLNPSLGHFSK